MLTVRLAKERFGMGSRDLLAALARRGIQARPLWQPMHRSKSQAGSHAWQIEVADQLWTDCLSLPCSVGLTEAQQDSVIAAVRDAAGGCV